MNREKENGIDIKFVQHILLVTAVVLLPGMLGALFGWFHLLLPLLIFFYLQRYGKSLGIKYILSGCVLACIAGLIFQIFGEILFSLTLVPVGFAIAGSADKGEEVYLTGLKGTFALGATWVGAAFILSLGMEQHPYTVLIASLNQAMDEVISYYRTNSTAPAETLYFLEQSLAHIKIWMPRLLPSILTCITIIITWFSMVAGNRLLLKKTGKAPWPQYRLWKLPDKLIWLVIGAAILSSISVETGRIVGVNILLICILLYSFQGLAIMLFFFSKWSVPVFLRSIIYVILFFQSFGMVFLAFLGMVDVWSNIRKLNGSIQEPDN